MAFFSNDHIPNTLEEMVQMATDLRESTRVLHESIAHDVLVGGARFDAMVQKELDDCDEYGITLLLNHKLDEYNLLSEYRKDLEQSFYDQKIKQWTFRVELARTALFEEIERYNQASQLLQSLLQTNELPSM